MDDFFFITGVWRKQCTIRNPVIQTMKGQNGLIPNKLKSVFMGEQPVTEIRSAASRLHGYDLHEVL